MKLKAVVSIAFLLASGIATAQIQRAPASLTSRACAELRWPPVSGQDHGSSIVRHWPREDEVAVSVN